MSESFKDFAFGRGRILGAKVHLVLVLTAVIAGVGMLIGSWMVSSGQIVDAGKARAPAWSIAGPPCPQLTQAQFAAQGVAPKKSFEFGKVRFARRFGHAECASIGIQNRLLQGAYPVCQFTAPALIEVDTPRGRYFFAPGVGRRATVSVPNGQARCVLAGKFTG